MDKVLLKFKTLNFNMSIYLINIIIFQYLTQLQ